MDLAGIFLRFLSIPFIIIVLAVIFPVKPFLFYHEFIQNQEFRMIGQPHCKLISVQRSLHNACRMFLRLKAFWHKRFGLID